MTAVSTNQEVMELRRDRPAALARIDQQTERMRRQFELARRAAADQEDRIRRSPLLRAGRAVMRALSDGFAST